MKGFFEKEIIEETSIKEKPIRKVKQTNNNIKKEYTQEELCEKCQLYKTCLSPKMNYTGNGKKEVLVIAEAPGKFEDQQNIQLIGEAGQTLRTILKEINIDLDNDCWKVNVVRCRTENNRTPTTQEIKYCKGNLLKTIDELNPKKIITLGKIALEALIGHKESITSLEQWVGWGIPDQEYKLFIYPNYHPPFLNYNKNDEVLRKVFKSNLYNVFYSNKKFKEYKPVIHINGEYDAYKYLINLQSLKNEIISIDIETSGLKPHKKGHFIYSCSITHSNLFTFSFLITDELKKILIQILENKNIGKVIQNSQFEFRWFKEIFNTEINNVIWDTQLASHVLDNRSGVTGLKFQTYVNFGISDYSQNIKKYLEAKEKGGNEFNRIKEAPVDELLTYNAYDSYYTMLLYLKQRNQLDNHLMKGFKFFLEGNLELVRLSGIRFNKEIYEKNYKELTDKINELHSKIMSSKELNLLENKENFNYNSDKQLRELLFDKCKWSTNNITRLGKFSVDEDTLKRFDRRFTNLILERRKLCKIRDTYLEQFIREAVEINDEYFIFPFFSLNNVKTTRSSSSNPNFQNIPKRDEYAQRMTRSCLIPKKGHRLLEIDFKQTEVCTSCCYHFDPVMINYVSNNGDMHGDLAKQLYMKNSFTKWERYTAKNGFVFPSFYGSTSKIYLDEHKERGYGEITLNLWEMIKQETKDHLIKNEINSIYDFQRHVEDVENDFWNNRFKVYKQWKLDNWKFYKENGYVELKTGFRCTTLMNYNDVNNYPIQGSSFHILLNTLIKVNQFLRQEKFNSVIIGQIHDSLVMDIDPAELNYIIKIVKDKIEEVKKEWEWIIVPLSVEMEITDINKSWNEKKELKI